MVGDRGDVSHGRHRPCFLLMLMLRVLVDSKVMLAAMHTGKEGTTQGLGHGRLSAQHLDRHVNVCLARLDGKLRQALQSTAR
jgi:hypothetical protein